MAMWFDLICMRYVHMLCYAMRCRCPKYYDMCDVLLLCVYVHVMWFLFLRAHWLLPFFQDVWSIKCTRDKMRNIRVHAYHMHHVCGFFSLLRFCVASSIKREKTTSLTRLNGRYKQANRSVLISRARNVKISTFDISSTHIFWTNDRTIACVCAFFSLVCLFVWLDTFNWPATGLLLLCILMPPLYEHCVMLCSCEMRYFPFFVVFFVRFFPLINVHKKFNHDDPSNDFFHTHKRGESYKRNRFEESTFDTIVYTYFRNAYLTLMHWHLHHLVLPQTYTKKNWKQKQIKINAYQSR